MSKSDQEKAETRRQTEARRQPKKNRSGHEASRGAKQKKTGRSARSLSSRISRRDLDDSEFDSAINEFHAGSDRVAAIMGAALIENNLIEALKGCLADASDWNALFGDQSAPFNTFKAKIIAGRAFGLYNEKVFRDLDAIRDIRNQFAHALLRLDFDHPDIARKCDTLANYVFHVSEEQREVGSSRLRFEKACWTISFGLLILANDKLDEKVQKLKGQGLGAVIARTLENAWEIPSMNDLVTSRLNGG